MNYKEFQKSSKRTLANLVSKKEDLSHMVMGICSEIKKGGRKTMREFKKTMYETTDGKHFKC